METNTTKPIVLIDGTAITFLIQFTAPYDYTLYNNFTVIDYLANGLIFDPNTTFIKVNNSIIPNWQYTFDKRFNEIKINIVNNIDIAGNSIEVYIGSKVKDASQIQMDMVISNTAYVNVNNNSNLSTASDEVDVYFTTIQSNEISIHPNSINQTIQGINGNDANFTMVFLASPYDTNHLIYNVIATIPNGLIFNPSTTSVTISSSNNTSNSRSLLRVMPQFLRSNSNPEVDVNYVYNKNTGRLSIDITNSANYNNMIITITLGTKINDINQLGNNSAINVDLGFNNDSSTVISTQSIAVNFINLLTLYQTVDNSQILLETGQNILFTGVFTIPQNSDNFTYNNFSVSDVLAPGLAFTLENSSVKLANGESIESMVTFPENMSYGEITIDFNNYSGIQDQVIFVNIETEIVDISKIPDNLNITNTLSLIVNGNPNTIVYSNDITIAFIEYSSARQQSLNNVITSISIIQESLNMLINAESNLFQRAKEIGATPRELSRLNNSIQNVIRTIASVEKYEEIKLRIASE
ncbi:hypothetical protein [Clostridium sp.]|uniref:hypothetical protein n=1 Tax=Clostridium sp. TaxID=1506 RepID=UPI003F2C9B87